MLKGVQQLEYTLDFEIITHSEGIFIDGPVDIMDGNNGRIESGRNMEDLMNLCLLANQTQLPPQHTDGGATPPPKSE